MNIRSIDTVLSRVEKNKDKYLWLTNILVVKVFVNSSPVIQILYTEVPDRRHI
jgi:hypothetical protein